MDVKTGPPPVAGGEQLKRLHAFASFTAFCVFFLIIAGGLVTSNDAGLAVPDWPLSYGKLMPPMVGGIFYEHGHRMVATFVGMLTVILALWTRFRERRCWVRRLAWLSLAAVITQGALGGITVLYFLPPPVSMAHASLAQAFFCMTVTLAVVTGRKWFAQAPAEEPEAHPSLRALSLWVGGAVYLQLILGAGNRHNAIGVASHVVGASVVVALTAWLLVQTVRHYPREWRRHAAWLAVLVTAQTVLGVAVFLIKNASVEAVQPEPARVWSATSHVALGALILATALMLALRAHRRFPGFDISSRRQSWRAVDV
ncbi:MAG: COX15/CtaA family protein [Acidobacteria bacterium]|nr:COX15/CtaA family protein [Acidobacteriota bacterium]